MITVVFPPGAKDPSGIDLGKTAQIMAEASADAVIENIKVSLKIKKRSIDQTAYHWRIWVWLSY
jgi:hypothetical protein